MGSKGNKKFSLSSRLDELLAQANIKRALVSAKLAVVFETFSLFSVYPEQLPWLKLAIAASVIASICLLAVVEVRSRIPSLSLAQQRRLYFGYWLTVMLTMTPYFYIDAAFMNVPLNSAIFYALLVISSVLTRREIFVVFPVCCAYICGAQAIFGAPASLVLASAVICAGAMTLACAMHRCFIDMTRKLQTESETDQLTGLLNKRAGMARMGALHSLCKRMGKRYAVYFIDIDYFKNYNDTYGHMKGDVVLTSVAQCMSRCFTRDTDVVCRLGGEEFAIMIADASAETACKLAGRLTAAIESLNIKSGKNAAYDSLSVSIGVTMNDFTSTEGSESEVIKKLLAKADDQLYIAKRAGRGCTSMNGLILHRCKERADNAQAVDKPVRPREAMERMETVS